MTQTRANGATTTPGGLIRFWLCRQHEHHRLDVPGFARTIGVGSAMVHHWLAGRRGISDKYWDEIATFFEFKTPEALLEAARTLQKRATATTRSRGR